jgi:hypothetical protein
MLQQLEDNSYVAPQAGLVKRRIVVIIRGVDVSSSSQKVSNLCHVVLFSCYEQFQVSPIHYFVARWRDNEQLAMRTLLVARSEFSSCWMLDEANVMSRVKRYEMCEYERQSCYDIFPDTV